MRKLELTLQFKFDTIKNDIPLILNWMEELGVNFLHSRYIRYMIYYNDFFSSNYNLPDNCLLNLTEVPRDMQEKYEKMKLAMKECTDIWIIYKTFHMERSEGFIERLQKIIKGADFTSETKDNDSSRDFLYELMIAAKLKKNGFGINFDTVTDIIAEKNDILYFIECKRIKSLKKFEENYKKAGKQIEREKKDNSYGLIFIDIYNMIKEDIPQKEYLSHEEINNSMNTIFRNFSSQNANIIKRLNERFKDASLGICLSAKHIYELACPINGDSFQYFDSYHIVSYPTISNKDFDNLINIFK